MRIEILDQEMIPVNKNQDEDFKIEKEKMRMPAFHYWSKTLYFDL